MSPRFTNVAPVFAVDDVRKTRDYYVKTLGFKYAEHFDKIDNFATVYRDEVEFVIVQKRKGNVESNANRYGAGFDAYIDTETIDGIDEVYAEFKGKGAKILSEPRMTDYGSYEFVIEDIDGRHIGIGLIKDKNKFFQKSNYLEGA